MNPPYPKHQKRKLTGHLVGVPLDNGTLAGFIVLWQSLYLRNVITLGITSTRVSHANFQELSGLVSLIDTSAAVIRSGFWYLGPLVEVTIPPEISTRISAEQVWHGDTAVRVATPEDRKMIPSLAVAGMTLVADYIRFLDCGEPDASLFRRTQDIMKAHLIRNPIVIGKVFGSPVA